MAWLHFITSKIELTWCYKNYFYSYKGLYLKYGLMRQSYPVKTLLQDLTRKGPFFLHPCKILQDSVGSCRILWDYAGNLQESCRNFVQYSCKILANSHKIAQDPAGSCKILQDLTGMQEKGTFLVRSCKSNFTGSAWFLDIRISACYNVDPKIGPMIL